MCFCFTASATGQQDIDQNKKRLIIDIKLASFNHFTEKPYVALWYSSPTEEKTPLLVLRGDSKWLRDLKSFWRYIARYQRDKLDGVTSATVKSGEHQFSFNVPQNATNQALQYWIEVVRENGARELLNVNMTANIMTSENNLNIKNCIQGKKEIASFCVSYH